MRLSLLPILVLASCTLNVDAVSDEKSARYEGAAYDTLRMRLSDVRGSVRVNGGDGAMTSARASLAALVVTEADEAALHRASITLDPHGTALDLTLHAPELEDTYVDWMDLDLPATSGVDIETGTADLDIAGVKGQVRVDNGTGNVTVRGASAVDVSVGTGSVRADAERGRVYSGTGDLDVTLTAANAGGSLQLECGTGDVTLRVPRGVGLSVHLSTGTGRVRVDAGGLHLDQESDLIADLGGGGFDVQLETGTGDVRVIER